MQMTCIESCRTVVVTLSLSLQGRRASVDGRPMKTSGWSRASRQQRGYGTEWDKKRRMVMARDCYLCQCTHCKEEDRVSIAHEVDHIVSRAKAKALGWSKEKTESMDNLQSINRDCHKRKTKEEVGATHRPKKQGGLDGWLIEA